MPREKEAFWGYVQVLQDRTWTCTFCGKKSSGGVRRIKAHLAGFGGYGIDACEKVNQVDPGVRSEAQKALKGEGAAELSNMSEGNVQGYPHLISSNLTQGPHQPVTESNEVAWMDWIDTSSFGGANSSAILQLPEIDWIDTSSFDGANSSAILQLPETNLPNQFQLPETNSSQMDFSFLTQPPQHRTGDSHIQPWNMSDPSSGGDLAPEALANMPGPVNAKDGEPNTGIPQPQAGEEVVHQPVTANNEDAPRETSVAVMPYQSFDSASLSAFIQSRETNLPSQSLPAQVPILQMDRSFLAQPPQHHARESYIQRRNLSDPSSGGDLAPEALANMPGSVNAEEGERNTEIVRDARTDYALMDSQSSTCGVVDKNMPTRKRKLEEVSNREELETWCGKSLPLVTTELVGEESEVTIKKICDYLMEDEIDIVGIYGMGGVGKTAILMHVHNRILLKNPIFNSSVFWVDLPQKFSVYELQDEIANAVGLDSLPKDKNVKRRASILHRHLEKMKSPILLLDGLWMHFEVKDVGIPTKKGGLKLVLTTRSLDVCHKMVCKKQIKIRPLLWPHDSWSLFLEKLCSGKELPSKVEEIARSILKKCEGLPLGIIEIATHMRGVETVHEWNDLLQKLQESRMELEVLKELKLSYANLGCPQVQRCFLHLVLCFGERPYLTGESGFVESLIDEGLLDGIATRQIQHDRGNTILDKIGKSGLLDDPKNVGRWSVHPLIRDMALQISTSTTHMVKNRMRLEEFPEEELWTDHLEKVFLQGNNIKKIPYSLSPNCPKLTSLSLNGNYSLEAIDRSFFKHLKELKVLDLSETKIMELPETISQLESLEALLLQECEELRRIPCVGKLGSLKKLDLRGCRMLKVVPEGMEMLVKLTYLDLRDTEIEMLSEGVLGKLLNLQYLAIEKLRAGEEKKLKKVEALYCSVPNVETFNACTRFLEQKSSRKYALGLGLSRDDIEDYERSIFIETRKDGGNGGDDVSLLLPKNVQELEVRGCGGVTRLCEVGPLHDLEVLTIKEWENLEELGNVDFPRLKRLTITGCPKLKHLWEERQGPVGAPNLERIIIKSCEKLEEIIGIGGGPVPSGVVTCGRLEYLELYGCNNMKRVPLTRDMLLHFPSLRGIYQSQDCEEIEEIIGGGPF